MKSTANKSASLPVGIPRVPKEAKQAIDIVGRMFASLETAQKNWYGPKPDLALTDEEKALLAKVWYHDLDRVRDAVRGMAASVTRQAETLVAVLDEAMRASER